MTIQGLEQGLARFLMGILSKIGDYLAFFIIGGIVVGIFISEREYRIGYRDGRQSVFKSQVEQYSKVWFEAGFKDACSKIAEKTNLTIVYEK